MQTPRERTVMFAVTLLTLFLLALSVALNRPAGQVSGATQAKGKADHEAPTPTVGSKVPEDVTIPTDFPATKVPVAFFDDYSWQHFLALNWPALEDKRGVADAAKKLGGKSPAVVWETWKAAHELFQPGGAAPSEWDSFEAVPLGKGLKPDDSGKVRQLISFSNFGRVLEDFNQAGFGDFPVGPLVAQNRTYVLYELRVNRPHYEFIRGNSKDPKTFLYLRQNVEGVKTLSFPAGSTVIKMAWRQFRPEEKHLLDRYYVAEALVVDRQTRAPRKQKVGLVGMHIVQKTPSRPQWIWSTFEHVDNVAVGHGAPKGTTPTFQDPDGPKVGGAVNDLPSPINAANPPQAKPKPVQVVRFKPIPESTRKTNSLYQNHPLVKETVWRHYELVATQWPTKPKDGGNGSPFPQRQVANVTMETEHQPNSCITCHGHTKPTDFMWMLRTRSYPPTGKGLMPAVKALRESRKK